MDRCGRLLRRRVQVSELRLELRPFDIAFLFPGAAACAPFPFQRREAAREFPKHERRRWLPLRAGATEVVRAVAVAECFLREAAGPLRFAPARGRDSESFRYQCAPSCLQRARKLLS